VVDTIFQIQKLLQLLSMAHGSMTLKWAFLNLEIQVIRVFLVKRDFCVFNVDIVMCGLSFNSTIFFVFQPELLVFPN
jgi:hypothetical protein